MTKIVLVDDHTFFRTMMKAAFQTSHPDIWGVDVTLRLRSEYPKLKIIAVSGENTKETIQDMAEAGIDGFLSKQNSSANELAEAIHSVMNGIPYFGRVISAVMFDVYVAKKKSSAITPEFTNREREIILLCRDGLLCKEIADRLSISIYTVNAHKRNIFRKLGINSTIEMVRFALKSGIIRVL